MQLTIPGRKAFSVGSIASVILFLVSIIVMAINILLAMGFTKGGVEASIPNMEEFTSNYLLDTMLGLSEWDGECGCLAKGTIVSAAGTEKLVIYPGLVPVEKLDSMNDKCFRRVREGSVIMLKDTLIGFTVGSPGYILDKLNGATISIPVIAIPIINTTTPLPATKPKQYITYQYAGSGGYALLVTSEPAQKTYLKNGDTIHISVYPGQNHNVDYVISPPACIAAIGSTETYHDPYWKPWKMEVSDTENGRKWEFGVKDCPLLRSCITKKVSGVFKVVCDPSLSWPDLAVYKPVWDDPEERIIAIEYGGIVHAGKAKFQLGNCRIDKAYQQVPA